MYAADAAQTKKKYMRNFGLKNLGPLASVHYRYMVGTPLFYTVSQKKHPRRF